ncbi:uncharacterized protein LOC132755228 isoform X2 [Ruditapes philippinarum]|uniref:uncharacterized protein LOC132755228 isoform X2 n=1 Tax=Ruditapes philippinarum TaxID=129788 RepID=UPI00295AB445|nr:uncharacterized protein LOC132755228 isoform X2 [Ruditapes philippinarum]
MRLLQLGLFFVIQFQAANCDATFSPNVTVVSCASQRVIIQLENAAEDGLIFIQGRDTSCSRTTVAEKRSYEFDFKMCNIEYDAKFRIVVQKKIRYQTGSDKVIPVMCLVDTSDLYVSAVVFPEEKVDGSSVNKTVRPTVSMRILASETFKSVDEVSLSDQVLLSLKLDNPYLDDFDIKAKDCRAEMINLVENECSQDEQLFPNFEKKARGDITSGFQAFQPTSLDDATEVDVSFTCNVAVCKGECHKKVCGTVEGWGRKRRDDGDDDDGDDDDDDDVDEIFEKVTCATKLKVKSSKANDFIYGVTSKLKGQLCAEKVAIASVMAVTVLILLVSWIVCACVTVKLRRVSTLSDGKSKTSTLRRLSEKNINFARSVGRRLSHMLNIPVGYNVREPNMMHECIPETDPSPPTKRRDSVTVTRVVYVEQ